MLKLERLDISGFKTFVDPVTVDFAGGITAIVGPNGCGKSNLADAIVWVLGEQSAKSLRSSTMEDVIFSGSEGRRPVGLAEVTLTLDADPSIEHAIDGKIRIGRRVFRTGESQYRLNGKLRRLKEIKDILMDTGLGIRAYSVIEQGKIGMILSGKPQERRKLLEEAAGITRYKQRKRIAEVKLEEAIANLLRLDDIISEVERALRSLKRQAGAARRYQTKEREYHELLRRVLLGRWSRLRDNLGGIDDRLGNLVDRDSETSAELHRFEAALAEGREELDRLSRELAERHQQQAELAAVIEGRQEFLRGARQRLTEVGERVEQGEAQAGELAGRAAAEEESLGTLDERTTALVAEHEAAVRRVEEDDTCIAAAQLAVDQAEARLESLRQELLGSLSRVNQLRGELQREQVEVEKRVYRRRFLGEEDERLTRQLGEARSVLAAIEEKITATESRLADRQEERERISGELEDLLARESDLNDACHRLESELAGLRQREEILVQLSEEHAGRRRRLADQLAAIGVDEPRFLADQSRPVEGWEQGIDQLLGDLADAVVLDPGNDGLALASALAETGTAGIFLVPSTDSPSSETGEAPDVEDPSVLFTLAQALGLPPEIGRALPPAYLVAGAEDAARLAARHPGVAFLSRDRLWALAGTLRVPGASAAPGILERQSELESIRGEIPATEERLDDAFDQRRRLVEDRTARASALNRLDDEIAELRREIAVAQARRQDARLRRERLEKEHSDIVCEVQELEAELGTRSEKHADFSRRLREAEAGHENLNRSFDRTRDEVEAARAEREARRTEGAGHRGRLELLEERMESQQLEVARVRSQIEDARRQVASWREERAGLENRRQELEVRMSDAEDELQAALDRRAEAQDSVLGQQELLDQRRDSLRELDDRVQTVRTDREELRNQIEEHRVERASLRQDAEHLGATYCEHFKRLLPGISELHPTAAAAARAAAADAGDQAAAETDELDAVAEDAVGVAEAAGEESAADEAGVPERAAADGPEEVEAANGDANGDATRGNGFELIEDDVEVPLVERAQLAEMEADLARIKAILERLGPVNVLAAAEYEEQQEREAFLKAQRKDVAQSVESLKTTIREINETSSERFRQTFEDVNVKFGEVFAHLFRGGEAQMRLLDEDDILESGIEIIARPPGKRNQSIMLLSGGEKALTAVALLFSLFQTKPSPFCILDEVDAPLDDANVLRFVDALRDMAQDTQFLVVTHNKLTMEVASTLYGVTMEERGVSKLVSVELDDVHAQPSSVIGPAANESEPVAAMIA